MLDIRWVIENLKLVEQNNASRNVTVELDELIHLYEDATKMRQEADKLRADRNKMSKTRPSESDMDLARKLGDEIEGFEILTKRKDREINQIMYQIPNINHESTPIAPDESGNVVVKTEGKIPEFSFEAKEHIEIPNIIPLIDMERGAKTSGSRFYYLKGKLAILERAIIQFAIDTIQTKGFELVLPPMLVSEKAMFGTGFFPAEKSEIYSVNPDEDNLYLSGTSEVPMVFMHSGEVLETAELPKKYVAITPCFRREAGSYGKDTKGLFRVHQFYKVEMVIFCHPKDSWKLHEEILAHEETVLQALGLPYQVVNICSGDLGFPAAKKYDCEGWFPGQGKYRELTSTSNTTDYQARRSNVKFKNEEGKREFVHTLNGTAVTDRAMLAILENYQQADGSVVIPEVLRKYTGFDVI